MTFQYHNCPPSLGSPPSPLPPGFMLAASPGSDMWKKPPDLNAFNVPICYRTLPLSAFRRARVTVTAEWKTQFDQGGLCLIIPGDQQQTPDGAMATERKWVKTGIEVYNGVPRVSTVACDRWADWSLFPLPGSCENGRSVTMEIEREVVDRNGTSTLWVFVIEEDGVRKPVREIAWVFGEVGEADGECWVGIYAAKPMRDEDDSERQLKVTFDGLIIESW